MDLETKVLFNKIADTLQQCADAIKLMEMRQQELEKRVAAIESRPIRNDRVYGGKE
jgi:hypothetical protein